MNNNQEYNPWGNIMPQNQSFGSQTMVNQGSSSNTYEEYQANGMRARAQLDRSNNVTKAQMAMSQGNNQIAQGICYNNPSSSSSFYPNTRGMPRGPNNINTMAPIYKEPNHMAYSQNMAPSQNFIRTQMPQQAQANNRYHNQYNSPYQNNYMANSNVSLNDNPQIDALNCYEYNNHSQVSNSNSHLGNDNNVNYNGMPTDTVLRPEIKAQVKNNKAKNAKQDDDLEQEASLPKKASILNFETKFNKRTIKLSDYFKDNQLWFDSLELPEYGSEYQLLVPKKSEQYVFDNDNLNFVLRYLQNSHGDSLYISGPTGCGKTSFILEVAARLNWPVESITLSQNSEVADLIGHNIIRKGQVVFEYGPLSRAMMFGEILLLNEIDLMSAGELASLNDVLEGRALCVNANNGELIYPHPFFRVIATANSKGLGDTSGNYVGVRKQNKAFLDRWIFTEFDYPDQAQESSLILKSITNINPDLIKFFTIFARELRFGAGVGLYKSNQYIINKMKAHIKEHYKNYQGNLEALIKEDNLPKINKLVEKNNTEQLIDELDLSLTELDHLNDMSNAYNLPLSVPLSTRSLLRIVRFYVDNLQLSICDAVLHGFASRLESHECAYVIRMSFEVFGYDSYFDKLPRTINRLDEYIKFREQTLGNDLTARFLLSVEQLQTLTGQDLSAICKAETAVDTELPAIAKTSDSPKKSKAAKSKAKHDNSKPKMLNDINKLGCNEDSQETSSDKLITEQNDEQLNSDSGAIKKMTTSLDMALEDINDDPKSQNKDLDKQDKVVEAIKNFVNETEPGLASKCIIVRG